MISIEDIYSIYDSIDNLYGIFFPKIYMFPIENNLRQWSDAMGDFRPKFFVYEKKTANCLFILLGSGS